MKVYWLLLPAICVSFLACSGQPDPVNDGRSELTTDRGSSPSRSTSLAEARRGFQTKLTRREAESDPLEEPPAELFRIVSYDAPKLGKMVAYLSRPPRDGKRHPAIVWIFGGFSNSIGSTAWEPASADNDQSASAFRQAGIITMYPSLRGGVGNPGYNECFYGEVNDVIAAASFLAKQPFVDPDRIYLGGHSTGGTLAILVAESSDIFRAVFSFGPVSEIAGYGSEYLPFDLSDSKELELRSPVHWLNSIKNPTFVFEGTEGGNIFALREFARATNNAQVHLYEIRGADHFSILAPLTRLIARKIIADDGPVASIEFSTRELDSLFQN